MEKSIQRILRSYAYRDIFSVAEVLKTLTFLNSKNPSRSAKKRMLDRARYLVISELALSAGSREARIEPRVDQACVELATSTSTRLGGRMVPALLIEVDVGCPKKRLPALTLVPDFQL
jgi:hypothetical protein